MTFDVTGNNTTVNIYISIGGIAGNITSVGPLTQKYFSQIASYSRSSTILSPGTYTIDTYAYINNISGAACKVDHVDCYALGNLSG